MRYQTARKAPQGVAQRRGACSPRLPEGRTPMARMRLETSKAFGRTRLTPLIAIMAACDATPVKREQPDAELKHTEAADVRRYVNFSRPDSVVGELVYVPVYSSVFHHRQGEEYFLTATLSVHNIHLAGPMWLTAVNYYNTLGQRVREMVDEPVILRPLETKQFLIPRTDKAGGTGANYIVKWEADRKMPSPKIEALMISTVSRHGISFLTHGTVVTRLSRTATTSH